MESMNIGELIEKAEAVYYDGQLGFAEKIIMPVTSKVVGGRRYQLQVVMTSAKEEIIEVPQENDHVHPVFKNILDSIN